MPNRVVHFEIAAVDLDRAKKFYTDAFGWKMDQMGSEMGNYVVVQTGEPTEPGGINGGLYTQTPEMGEKTNAFMCVVSVQDVPKSMKDVTIAGGKTFGEPMDIPGVGLYVKCQDTEGNFFSLLQPAPEMTENK